MTETENFITDEVRALIGIPSPVAEAPEPVDRSSIRRFVQAIMDEDPIYVDDEAARSRGYSTIVAPPLFPVHAMRRPVRTPDPLDAMIADPDYDGAGNFAHKLGLPDVPVPLKRLLNGGNSVHIWSLAELGDVIVAESQYEDIYQKQGRGGPMVFCIVRTAYSTKENKRPLLTARQTHIRR